MKKLSKEEMKKIIGGVFDGGDGDVPCKTTCYVWNKERMGMDQGTCSSGSVKIGNTTLATCDCSIVGAGDCYA